MPQPTPYTRAQNFTTWQAANPGVWPAATDLDAEFNALKTTTDDVRRNMALVQADDGGLVGSLVGMSNLKSDVVGLLVVSGCNPRGLWGAAISYAVRDVVTQSGLTYICAAAHTSGTFATDLAAGYWATVSGGTGGIASAVSVTPTGGIGSTNVQAALAELDSEKAPATASLTALSSVTPASNQLPYFTGASAAALTAFTAVARTLVAAADKAALRAAMDAVTGPAAAPTQYALAMWNTGTLTLDTVNGVGSTGQVLTSNGSGVAPTWQSQGSSVSPNDTINTQILGVI